MFKKSQRINSREFKILMKKGKKSFSRSFRVVSFPGYFSCAVVVPKKIYKKRVKRNREKRRITHALKEISYISHKKLIIFIQKDISLLSFDDLIKELEQLLKK